MFAAPSLICRRCMFSAGRQAFPTTCTPAARRFIYSQQKFSPATPPNPDLLPKAAPAKQYRRTRKWLRRLLWASAIGGAIALVDNQFYASALTRSARTFKTGIVVGLDYKINFRAHPWFAKSIGEVHTRSAQRMFDMMATNGGLYLKIGQAVAMQSAVLPPEFQKMFAKMFDDAHQNSWEDVEKVIREDFGKSPEEVFGVSFTGEPGKGVMEKTARASASVAQVHWARLLDGTEVAIKVQKREIAKQVGWDLWAFKVICRFYSWWFDLPMYTMIPFVTERLMLETDFVNEADNSELMKSLVEEEPRLKGRVYIPKVYRELSSRRIMTAEWIEGTRLWDKQTITGSWKGGWRKGTPGCHGTPLDPPAGSFQSRSELNSSNGLMKPVRDHWKGSDGKGGLGLSMSDVMTTMVDLFSAQMFLWGTVHCDPHPGNIFVRRQPSGKAELVLIDHGLYVTLPKKFRLEYAGFWKALMTFDNKRIKEIVTGWGIGTPDLFASMTLLRPYEGGDHSTSDQIMDGLHGEDEQARAYELQKKMRHGIREMLADEKKWPNELIFIARNFRIVQGNNQFLGSPVNRVKITGEWASRALIESGDLPVRQRLVNFGRHIVFKFVLLGSDFVFYFSKLRQFFGLGGGMEQDLEDSMKNMAKGFGVELNHGIFEG